MKPKTTKNNFTLNMLVLNNTYCNCIYEFDFHNQKLGVMPIRREKENTQKIILQNTEPPYALSNPQKPLAQYSGSPSTNAKLKEGTDLKTLLRNR